MGIISYVPKKTAIRDRRKPEGGWYKAECDLCGQEFYPSRSNAKFCSQACAQANYRKNLAKGGKVVASKEKLKVMQKKWKDISPEEQLKWSDLKEFFAKKRLKQKFLNIVSSWDQIPIDESCDFEIKGTWYRVIRTNHNGFDLLVRN